MNLISAQDLNQKMKETNDYFIVDIREPYEYEMANIGCKHIPMGEICDRITELPKDKINVLMCRSGKRAEAVANILQTDFSLPNVLILEGGILAWKESIEPTLNLD